MKVNRNHLKKLYARYNRREFVHPDPLEFLYDYDDVRDREIVALIASSLAYGRVRQILKSVSTVLSKMPPSPSAYLKKTTNDKIKRTFKGFKHRFTTGDDIACLLIGMKSAIENHGSLEKCFLAGLRDEHETVIPALSIFVTELWGGSRRSLPRAKSRGSNNKVCFGLVPPPKKKECMQKAQSLFEMDGEER